MRGIDRPLPGWRPMLDVSGIHTHYGRAEILADVTFRVSSGEVVALLGRNGAGKSTTLKTIMGLVRPSRGEIHFDGEPVTHLQPFRISQRGLGYVPEDRRIFARLTVDGKSRRCPAAAAGRRAGLVAGAALRALPQPRRTARRMGQRVVGRRTPDADRGAHADGESARDPARRAVRGPGAGDRRADGHRGGGAQRPRVSRSCSRNRICILPAGSRTAS